NKNATISLPLSQGKRHRIAEIRVVDRLPAVCSKIDNLVPCCFQLLLESHLEIVAGMVAGNSNAQLVSLLAHKKPHHEKWTVRKPLHTICRNNAPGDTISRPSHRRPRLHHHLPLHHFRGVSQADASFSFPPSASFKIRGRNSQTRPAVA